MGTARGRLIQLARHQYPHTAEVQPAKDLLPDAEASPQRLAETHLPRLLRL